MTLRRVRSGADYRARLRGVVLDARDGDTIVVPGIREAVEVYCLVRERGGVDLSLRYESPWRIYQVLPEWAAALRHADLGDGERLKRIREVLRSLASSEPMPVERGLWYEQDGIQVLIGDTPWEPWLTGALRPDCRGAIVVSYSDTHRGSGSLVHVDGCPVAVVMPIGRSRDGRAV